jgi:hypothetical protein
VRRALVAFALVLAAAGGVAQAANDAALAVVDACRAKLEARDVGMERVQRRCPDLLPALDKAPWRNLLPREMRERREEISAESLRALAELVRAADAAPLTGATPDHAKLATVLNALGAQGQEGATRWERFRRWLKDKLERREKEDAKADWREEWLRKMRTSEGVAQVITYIGYGLVAALVAWVVWGELRAAGLLGGTRRSAGRANPAAAWRRRLMLADVAAAPLVERPGMLLRLVGEALTRARRLPASDGLTAAAIAQRAQLDAAADRERLALVAEVSETVRFAPEAPADAALERTVREAKALLERVAKLPAERG